MARAVKIDSETLVRVAKSLGYRVGYHTDGRPVFQEKCSRCYGEGVLRPFGTCFKCYGACWMQSTTKTVTRWVRQALADEAERAANGGKTNRELASEAILADLQAQRDRNGGLTDRELAEKQHRDAEAARVAAEAAAKDVAAHNDLARVQALYPVGERMVFERARIEKRFTGEGSYGTWVLTKMRLPNNIAVVYWNRVGSEGEDFSFKATVKAVEVNRGEVQVVVQRAKELATA